MGPAKSSAQMMNKQEAVTSTVVDFEELDVVEARRELIIKTLMPHPCSLAPCYNAAMSRSRQYGVMRKRSELPIIGARVRARAPRNLDAQS